MGIKQDMERMFNINKYTENKEYNERRRSRKDEILEKWINKQETFENRHSRLQRIDPIWIYEHITNIDKKFLSNIEEFVKAYKCKSGIVFSDRLAIFKKGRNIICNFIIERCDILIKSNAIFVPECENEHEVGLWFEENCNDLALEISADYKHHSKFIMKSISGPRSYGGIDHICELVDGLSRPRIISCIDNCYSPCLNRYMSEDQRKSYCRFFDFVEANFLVVELEYLSSNFVRHKHPGDIVDMVICYKKDKELSIPALELKRCVSGK